MEAYAAAKLRMFENQAATDYAVLNADDPRLAHAADGFAGSRVLFSRTRAIERGVFVDGDSIISTVRGGGEEICRVSGLPVKGAHNVENAMAVAAVAIPVGCPSATIGEGLRAFRGPEHAMELEPVLHGVAYINDSKGTNVDATIKALESLPAPVILIAGGREKGGESPGLADVVRHKAKQVILLGEARARLREVLAGVCPVTEVRSLAEAVRRAAALAVPGGTGVVSPACARFDLVAGYWDRGGPVQGDVP